MRARRRAAFSMIEIVVGLLLTIITFTVLWTLYYFDNKRVSASIGRLTALRGAESIVEHLRADLSSLALPGLEEYEKWGGKPLLLESAAAVDPGTFDRVTFYRRTAGKAQGEAVEKVVYGLDRATRRVVRQAAGRAVQIGATRVARFDIDFRGGLGGDLVLYEVAVPYGGMDSSAASAATTRLMTLRGQLALVDTLSQSRRTRWVPARPASK